MKKILDSNSVPTQPKLKNSKKKNSKKIQEIKKVNSDSISIQNGLRETEKEKEKKKILVPNSVHTRPGRESSERNSKKIQKIEKPVSGTIFSRNGMT